jgi:hypothetical protein
MAWNRTSISGNNLIPCAACSGTASGICGHIQDICTLQVASQFVPDHPGLWWRHSLQFHYGSKAVTDDSHQQIVACSDYVSTDDPEVDKP